MTTNLLFSAFAVCAGIASTVQSAANAGLAQRIGLGAALVVNTSIVMVASLVLFFGRGSQATFHTANTPLSLYVGGVCGFVFLLSLAYVFPGGPRSRSRSSCSAKRRRSSSSLRPLGHAAGSASRVCSASRSSRPASH
jgi:hypothetical protein